MVPVVQTQAVRVEVVLVVQVEVLLQPLVNTVVVVDLVVIEITFLVHILQLRMVPVVMVVLVQYELFGEPVVHSQVQVQEISNMLFVIQVENNTPIGLPYAYDNFLHMYPGVEYSEIHTVGYAPWVPTDMPPRPLKKQLVKCIETTPVWNEELQAYQQQWVWVDLEGEEYQQQLARGEKDERRVRERSRWVTSPPCATSTYGAPAARAARRAISAVGTR